MNKLLATVEVIRVSSDGKEIEVKLREFHRRVINTAAAGLGMGVEEQDIVRHALSWGLNMIQQETGKVAAKQSRAELARYWGG